MKNINEEFIAISEIGVCETFEEGTHDFYTTNYEQERINIPKVEDTSIFKCTKCGSTFKRTSHYKAIVTMQNVINMMMGNDYIEDLCSNCECGDGK